MSRHLTDHDHAKGVTRRAQVYARLGRIEAGEAGHPKVQMLIRGGPKGVQSIAGLRHFLRIERGRRA